MAWMQDAVAAWQGFMPLSDSAWTQRYRSKYAKPNVRLAGVGCDKPTQPMQYIRRMQDKQKAKQPLHVL
jgi:hypothetical protein